MYTCTLHKLSQLVTIRVRSSPHAQHLRVAIKAHTRPQHDLICEQLKSESKYRQITPASGGIKEVVWIMSQHTELMHAGGLDSDSDSVSSTGIKNGTHLCCRSHQCVPIVRQDQHGVGAGTLVAVVAAVVVVAIVVVVVGMVGVHGVVVGAAKMDNKERRVRRPCRLFLADHIFFFLSLISTRPFHSTLVKSVLSGAIACGESERGFNLNKADIRHNQGSGMEGVQ